MAKYVNSDNLSYYNGKIKNLLNGKANTSHTHTSLVDSTNSSSTCSMSYMAADKKYNEYDWIAVWDGTTLKSANKNQFAVANHTHNYAGSTSAGGAANIAAKLQTYKPDSTTETYGDRYPLYAQWQSDSYVKLKCDGYTVGTDYANSSGSANSAVKLATARSISLGGDLSGSATFDGSANITISASVTAMTNAEIDKLFA